MSACGVSAVASAWGWMHRPPASEQQSRRDLVDSSALDQRMSALEATLLAKAQRDQDFQSAVMNSIPVLRMVSDRAVAKAEAIAFKNSLRRQMAVAARGTDAMRAEKQERRARRKRRDKGTV
jgi:hypothetical protein